MQCARRRWGSGTTCEKQPHTPASKELQDRLAQMKAERANQDGMWGEPIAAAAVQSQTQSPIQLLQKTTTTQSGLLNYAPYLK